jgi:hypothetical protein
VKIKNRSNEKLKFASKYTFSHVFLKRCEEPPAADTSKYNLPTKSSFFFIALFTLVQCPMRRCEEKRKKKS